MSQTIQIKRRTTGLGQPTTLAPGELSYNSLDKTLVVGDAAGVPQVLVGASRQVELAGIQSIPGTKVMFIDNLKLNGGAANQFIKTDGAGNISFAAIPPTVLPATDVEMDAGTRNDVYGSPSNTRSLVGASVTALNTAAKTIVPAINELKSHIDQMGTGNLFVGQFNPSNSTITWTAASGGSGDALPAPAPANKGWQLISSAAGSTWPVGAPAGVYNSQDWLLSDGVAWTHLGFGGTSTMLASNVTVNPAVAGGTNVQTSLEGLQTQVTAKPDKTYVDAQDNLRVLKTGDIMTGNLKINGSAASIILNESGTTGSFIQGQHAGLVTWNIGVGSWTGFDFRLQRFDDAGTYLDEPFIISRATGLLTTGPQQINGNFSVSGSGALTGSLTVAATINLINSNNVLLSDGTNTIHRTAGSFYVQNLAGTVNYMISNSGGLAITGTLTTTGGNVSTNAINCTSITGLNDIRMNGYIMAGAGSDAGRFYFGVTGSRYWDSVGAAFTLVGASTVSFNGAALSGIGAITSSGNIASAGFLNAGYTTDYGLLYFGNTAGRYIEQNGAQFTFVGGRLNCNSDIHATGNLLADTGALFLGGSSALARAAPYTNFYSGGNICFIAGDSGEPSNYYRNSRHMLQSTAGADFLSVDGSGVISYGYLNANGNCTINGQLRIGAAADNSLMHFGSTGIRFISQVAESVQWTNINLSVSQGSLSCATGLYCRDTDFSNGCYVSQGFGYQPGGGAWRDSSDVRIKNIVGDYKHGLDEILKLQPRRFTYKGNDTRKEPSGISDVEAALGRSAESKPVGLPYGNSPHHEAAVTGKEFIGLIAQEAEVAMPEMITKTDGYINGVKVQDLREMDSTALIFALVNAVKTLTARVVELESKLS